MPLTVTRADDRGAARATERLAQAGKLRRVYAGVYTDDLTTPLEVIVRRELFAICAILEPHGVISHRSAFELRPTPKGTFFLTGPYRRSIKLPGLELIVARGPGPLASDIRIPTPFGATHRSSEVRALLENLSRSSGAAEARRTLGTAAVESWLERLLAREGAPRLKALRADAKRISRKLNVNREAERFDATIGALFGTRRVKLRAPVAVARSRGRPYDDARLKLFDTLLEHLVAHPPVIPKARKNRNRELQAFVESYFSNYIEGTEFEIEVAHDIVVNGKPLAQREDDSHDVLGTFDAIVDSIKHSGFPQSADAFVDQLRMWNRFVIRSRTARRPGEIKDEVNRAGNTVFVAPELVLGTLQQGFTRIMAAGSPEARAAMAMFVVSEVHPFSDGNGRTARLAMNLALSAGERVRIVIPTVFREDYLLALKALSREGEPTPYVRMLSRAAAFSHWLRYETETDCFAQLRKSNALEAPEVAQLRFKAKSPPPY
jgi:hypothetical protein